MMNKRLLILLSTNIVTCVLSVFLTLTFVGKKAAETMLIADDMLKGGMLVNHYSVNVEMQNAFGSPNEYEDALLAYIEALDLAKFETPANPLFSEKTYSTDKTFAYIRLAKLHEDNRNMPDFNKYKEKAIETCARIPWGENCTYEKLKEITTKLETNNSFKKTNN